MDKRNRRIIIEDSRSHNMLNRLLGTQREVLLRRRRWLLLANNGMLQRIVVSESA